MKPEIETTAWILVTLVVQCDGMVAGTGAGLGWMGC